MASPRRGAAALWPLSWWGQVPQRPSRLPTAGCPGIIPFAVVAAPLHTPMGYWRRHKRQRKREEAGSEQWGGAQPNPRLEASARNKNTVCYTPNTLLNTGPVGSGPSSLRFAGGEGAQRQEWQAYLWNSAEGQHPKDPGRAFSGAQVASPLPAEETQAAGKRGERRGTSTTTHRERRSWADQSDKQKGSVKRATARWSQPA